MSDDVLCAIDGAIATCTLNRPAARNALSAEMVADMKVFFAKVERDPAVRCLVVRGAGEHFQSGGDVKSFTRMFPLPPDERRAAFEEFIHQLHPAVVMMRRMPKPVIASVQGACAGFGMSLMMACDLAIAADSAYFTLAYINIGTSPDGSGTFFLPRLVGLRKALEIAMLGDRFDAATAKDLGLVNFVVPAAELAAATGKLAQRLASGPTHALGNTKRLLNMSFDSSLETQLQAEAASFADCTTTADMMDGVMAFVQKRPPRFQGR
jgi:2-(1,2-epoxy-1,2-dihydrophenyl)acetyl-CoA isomerase